MSRGAHEGHRCERRRDRQRTGSRSSAPAPGGAASTPGCSPAAHDADARARSSDATRTAPRQRAGEFGTRPYIDLDEMLDRERPDLVSVCLPNEGHFEPTLQVIRAGFPLLRGEAAGLRPGRGRHAARRGGAARTCSSRINFNHRYARPVRLAAEAIAPGRPRAADVRHLALRRRGRAPARTRTPTSSRPSATASTCSSTCAARSTR